MSGKGDARRPAQVSRETYAENYRRAFGDGARAVPAPLAEIAETGPVAHCEAVTKSGRRCSRVGLPYPGGARCLSHARASAHPRGKGARP